MNFYERFFAQHNTFVLKIAIFFIYLLIIYPACPARDEKSDDPPARVVAFSFARRGQSTSRKSTALQDDVPQLLFPVLPPKSLFE